MLQRTFATQSHPFIIGTSIKPLSFLKLTHYQRMGFHEGHSEAPWAIIRHDGDEGRHAHIVASRVRFDGSTVSDSYDFKRSHQARAAPSKPTTGYPAPSQVRSGWRACRAASAKLPPAAA